MKGKIMDRREFFGKGAAVATAAVTAGVLSASAAETTEHDPDEMDPVVAQLLRVLNEDPDAPVGTVVAGIRDVLAVIRQMSAAGGTDYGAQVRVLTKAMMIVNEEHRLAVNHAQTPA